VVASAAAEPPDVINDSEVAPFDPNRLAIDQRIRDTLARTLHNTTKRRTRDPHLVPRGFMGHAMQICQPNRLALVDGQLNFV
jgi:hypothetical protein